ncbi:hypothetical protein GA0115240_121111, partial [Streptomyces sp. DvalAA-14]
MRGMSDVSHGGDPVSRPSEVCGVCGAVRARPGPAPCERCGAAAAEA